MSGKSAKGREEAGLWGRNGRREERGKEIERKQREREKNRE